MVMKRYLNNNSRFICTFKILSLFLLSILILSCDRDELTIQDNFPFDVTVMPVRDEIGQGQTVEIRLTIVPTGNYSNSEYFIRYFQYDGQGTLQYYNEPAYLPNDLYPISSTEFRLYYTSQSTVSQSFEVWISDSFGNEKQLSFQFNNSD
jgi:hypothetical protein